MSKTTAPLLSFGASGQMAKTLVYSSWKGIPYARRHVVPANPRSPAQTETRSTFAWLNNAWRYAPAEVQAGWNEYAAGQPLTGRNAFIKLNLSDLREESDLTNFVMSPSAKAGPVASAMLLTAGSEQITVELTPPTLPDGWTVTRAIAAAIRQQDPQSGTLFDWTSGDTDTSPYQIVLSDLEASEVYVVGGWFEYKKPDGRPAFGPALQDTETPTA